MKKNLILTTSFPRYNGDYFGTFVYRLYKFYKNKENILVLAPNDPKAKKKDKLDDIQIERFSYFWPLKFQKLAYNSGLPANFKKSLLAKLQLPLLIISMFFVSLKHIKEIDIVHAHWPIAGIVAFVLKKIFKKKFILTVYGVEVLEPITKKLMKFLLKRADFVIFISSFTMKKSLAIYKPAHYKLLHLGIDLNKFKKVTYRKLDKKLYKKFDINPKEPLIFGLGILVKRKGFNYLIDAMKIVNEKLPCQCIIGGDGVEKENLIRQIKEAKLSKKIHLIGYLDNQDEIIQLYNQAKLFVLPAATEKSGNVEGLGVVILEAMACETPVIASKSGGIVDIITSGKDGYLVPEKKPEKIAEKIFNLLKNETLYKKMAKNARTKIEKKFNIQTISTELEKLYNTIKNYKA